MLGVVVVAASMMLVVPLVVLVAFAAVLAATGSGVDGALDALVLDPGEPVRPVTLAYLLTSLAVMIPVVWAVGRLHGLKPRWLSSVAPRIRWKFLLACLGVSVVAFIAGLATSVVVSLLDPSLAEVDPAVDSQVTLASWSATTRDFLLVVLLVTPFQAAAEEYVFRGYLTQVAGGIFSSERLAKVLAVLVPATLFALAHGAQNPPLFFDRFAFGVMAGVLVILTGGLEAPIAMHVVNNWFAFGLAVLLGQMDQVLTATESSWWAVPVTVVRTAVFLGGALLVHRWMRERKRADSAVLIASRGRVYGLSSAR
ncbi:type II CAAX endopeptidase family protein [Nocardioides zeae]|uniref:Type II CAAX endopeptidase family protein n=1 Tax=Nocardioides imazamoxiresistens TaxID=3231893 RepID=A0ABU3PXN3_9ACTN|nr:type II CAAX endopeptidase family protein [Nocardioides zeae]MDT9593924.1 type II CAAX endopeptidase family protein [Nocardioides zeae]